MTANCVTRETDVDFKTESGQQRSVVFQNAEVGMPILSTNKFAIEANEITYRAKDGYIHHVPTGENTPFIAKDGVYFLAMRVPRHWVEKGGADFHRHE